MRTYNYVLVIIVISAVLLMFSGAVYSQNITLAFVGDKSTFSDHNKAAFEWAQKTYNAQLIAPSDLAKADLTRFAVIWWHDGDTDPTDVFKVARDPLDKYVKSGGALLLSAAAEKLATPLGVESGEPRIYGPGADAQAAGLTIRADTINHPVWEGFNRKEGERIQVTSVGYPKSSDYWSNKFKDAITIGDCWETGSDWHDSVGAFVEWTKNTGKGIVFGMGWRLPHWTENNKDRPTLEKLTINVISYLASKSAFLSVKPSGNVITTWAEIKSK